MDATPEMIDAGFKVLWGTELSELRDVPANYKRTCVAIYRAMEAAKPLPIDEGLVERAIRKALVKETGGFGTAGDRKVAKLCARAAIEVMLGKK